METFHNPHLIGEESEAQSRLAQLVRAEPGFELRAICIDYAILPLHNAHITVAPPKNSNGQELELPIQCRVRYQAAHRGLTRFADFLPPSASHPNSLSQGSGSSGGPLHSPTPSPSSFQIQGLGGPSPVGPPRACFNLACPRAAFTHRAP